MRKIATLAAFAVAATTLALVGTPNATANRNDKIWICHATGSEKNPYVRIKVDANGLNGHGDHADDIIPAPEGGCPDSPPTPEPSPSPTATPTTSPSPSPTATPTTSPSPSPTATPTTSPSHPPTVPGSPVSPVVPFTPPSSEPGTPELISDPCAGTARGRTATGFVKFRYLIRPSAQADIDAFIESMAPGSCVKVYGFAGFNAKQWALDISQRRASEVANYLNARGFTTVIVDGLAKSSAADVFGSPLAHNRMVVLVGSEAQG